MEIKANKRDFETLIINAFRYSMPRFGTTAFGATEKIILDNLEYIQTWVLEQFVDDILWEYNRYEENKKGEKNSSFLDSIMDNPYVRKEFLNKIREEIKNREESGNKNA